MAKKHAPVEKQAPIVSHRLKRVTVTVNPDDYQALTRMAKTCDVSCSWLIRKGMRQLLKADHGK